MNYRPHLLLHNPSFLILSFRRKPESSWKRSRSRRSKFQKFKVQRSSSFKIDFSQIAGNGESLLSCRTIFSSGIRSTSHSCEFRPIFSQASISELASSMEKSSVPTYQIRKVGIGDLPSLIGSPIHYIRRQQSVSGSLLLDFRVLWQALYFRRLSPGCSSRVVACWHDEI